MMELLGPNLSYMISYFNTYHESHDQLLPISFYLLEKFHCYYVRDLIEQVKGCFLCATKMSCPASRKDLAMSPLFQIPSRGIHIVDGKLNLKSN